MQRPRVRHTSIFKSRCIVGHFSLSASMETRVDSKVAMEGSPGWGRWRQTPSETGQPVWPRSSQTPGGGATRLAHLQRLWYQMFYRTSYWIPADSMFICCHGNFSYTKVIFNFLISTCGVKCESFVYMCIDLLRLYSYYCMYVQR